MQETTLTYASLADQPQGRYHTTVVAYNHALDPSKPVCSSGVVVDMSPPLVSDIHVKSTLTADGLMMDDDGELWYITRDTFRCPLMNASDTCRCDTELITIVIFPQNGMGCYDAYMYMYTVCKMFNFKVVFFTELV